MSKNNLLHLLFGKFLYLELATTSLIFTHASAVFVLFFNAKS